MVRCGLLSFFFSFGCPWRLALPLEICMVVGLDYGFSLLSLSLSHDIMEQEQRKYHGRAFCLFQITAYQGSAFERNEKHLKISSYLLVRYFVQLSNSDLELVSLGKPILAKNLSFFFLVFPE